MKKLKKMFISILIFFDDNAIELMVLSFILFLIIIGLVTMNMLSVWIDSVIA